MKEEHRITYKAGITRSPSDFLCDNGELAECINLTVDNEEIKVMLPPKPITNISLPEGTRLLFVHNVATMKMYVYTENNDDIFVAYNVDNTSYAITLFDSGDYPIGDILQVSAIGKTLIFNGENGILYAVWKATSNAAKPYDYTVLDDIPTPEVEFYTSNFSSSSNANANFATLVSSDWTDPGSALKYNNGATIDDQQKYNDFVIGLYAEIKKKVHQKKAFLNPFLARVAIQLYDGTYTKITNPVLLFPSISKNCYIKSLGTTNLPTDGILYKMYARPANLHISLKTNYENYADIVKDVVLFLSPEIDIYDTTVDQPFDKYADGDVIIDGIRPKDAYSIAFSKVLCTDDGRYTCAALAQRDPDEIKDDIIASSVFYRVASLGMKGQAVYTSLRKLIHTHTLENLTTQELLPNDDYYSHAPFSADFSYVYNSRLNIFGLHRGFYEGFGHFLRYDSNNSTEPEHQYDIFVTIKTDSGERVVRKSVTTRERMGIWFYYPDPRATRARIFINTDDYGNLLGTPKLIHDLTLTEHPGLNGAYFFDGLPGDNAYTPTRTTQSLPTTNTKYEYLPNEVATSEVNNPFVFNAEGYNAVSNGRILGMATQTTALSQGQFGQYPLILFTSEGIWAMHVNSEGLYSAITPISRDVVTNPNAIVETDGAVFFPSDKGLMMIVGANVTCVSTKMNGSPDTSADWMVRTEITDNTSEFFRMISAAASDNGITAFLSDTATHAAYDYRNSRILFVRYNKQYALVYDIIAHTFSKLYNDTYNYKYTVRDYPDYILGNDSGTLYSMIAVGDESYYAIQRMGVLITRPVKFSGPVGIDSIREFKNVGKWDSARSNLPSSVETMLFFSDDMIHWKKASSRFGMAAKYWRWAIVVKLLPTERLSGTIIRTQPRRTDNTR